MAFPPNPATGGQGKSCQPMETQLHLDFREVPMTKSSEVLPASNEKSSSTLTMSFKVGKSSVTELGVSNHIILNPEAQKLEECNFRILVEMAKESSKQEKTNATKILIKLQA